MKDVDGRAKPGQDRRALSRGWRAFARHDVLRIAAGSVRSSQNTGGHIVRETRRGRVNNGYFVEVCDKSARRFQ
jgi:hypothetical protein